MVLDLGVFDIFGSRIGCGYFASVAMAPVNFGMLFLIFLKIRCRNRFFWNSFVKCTFIHPPLLFWIFANIKQAR